MREKCVALRMVNGNGFYMAALGMEMAVLGKGNLGVYNLWPGIDGRRLGFVSLNALISAMNDSLKVRDESSLS